jgi:uncharacterized protein (DUF697 family)
MVTCREEALRWVHRYAAGGAIFAAAPLPIPTSPVLAALETHMAGVIANIYGDSISPPATAAAGGTFTAMGEGLKYAVARAIKFVPIVGPVIRASIAASAIVAIGHAIVAHFERKYPAKVFTIGAA